MELKQITCQAVSAVILLLIVPYGIETKITFFISQRFKSLLIVPYGIETGNTGNLLLLIVPYGIETTQQCIRFRLQQHF